MLSYHEYLSYIAGYQQYVAEEQRKAAQMQTPAVPAMGMQTPAVPAMGMQTPAMGMQTPAVPAMGMQTPAVPAMGMQTPAMGMQTPAVPMYWDTDSVKNAPYTIAVPSENNAAETAAARLAAYYGGDVDGK